MCGLNNKLTQGTRELCKGTGFGWVGGGEGKERRKSVHDADVLGFMRGGVRV